MVQYFPLLMMSPFSIPHSFSSIYLQQVQLFSFSVYFNTSQMTEIRGFVAQIHPPLKIHPS